MNFLSPNSWDLFPGRRHIARPFAAPQPEANGGKHIVRRQRPPDPLQLELAYGIDFHGVLDFRQHSRADEDLPWLGFIAEPRGNIGYRPDGGIVEASFKPDGAERGNPCAIPMPKPMSCPKRRHPSVNLSSARRKLDEICQPDPANFSSRSARNTLLWRAAIHWRPLDVTFKYRIAV